MGIADAGGTWLVSYTYDAYGTVHWQYETNSEVQTDIDITELAELNPMLYRSYYCDRESGIYYLQSRYYLPDFGRFFNADLPEYAKLQKDDYAGTNLFAYCNNDPVNNSDPSGNAKKKSHIVTLFTIEEFKNETKVILNNLKSYFSVGPSYTNIISNSQSLKRAWNWSGDSSVAVINCHGLSDSINGLSRSEVLKLNKKKIKVLIILACHASELYVNKKNITFSNIASAFAKVISGGIVVASDGVVTSNSNVYSKSTIQHRFTSKYGWYLYRVNGKNITRYTTKKAVHKTITIKSILDYLVKEKLISW